MNEPLCATESLDDRLTSKEGCLSAVVGDSLAWESLVGGAFAPGDGTSGADEPVGGGSGDTSLSPVSLGEV